MSAAKAKSGTPAPHPERKPHGRARHRRKAPAEPKIGLALGGGVARGWAHIGVLRALNKAGIEPDIICGTSIGAVVGGCYLADHLDTLEDWARSLNTRTLLSYLDFIIGGNSLLGGRKLDTVLNTYLKDRTIETLDRPFVAVAAELATGHEVWIEDGPVTDAIQASYALPGIFAPLRRNGRWLIDGGLVNPVPVSVCRAKGARLVIAVTLNADSYGKNTMPKPDLEPIPEPDGWSLAAFGIGAPATSKAKASPERTMMRQLFGREESAPGMGTVMLGALNIVMDRLSRSRMAGDPPDVMVCPQIAHVGLLDFEKADELIALGEEAMERQLPMVKDALTVLA